MRHAASSWRPGHPCRIVAANTPDSARVRVQAADHAHFTAKRKNPELYAESAPAATAPLAATPAAPPPALAPAATSPGTPGMQPSPQRPRRLLQRPEVLAPAGGWPQLRAAVQAGADAVYFGVSDLNARARAANFTTDELPEVMHYLHERGVKGYLVLNVLVFDSELASLAERAQQASAAGVDAVIVQDTGAVEVISVAAPHLPIHGSTQMTITSAEGAAFAASRGVERVVVARELSVADIASVAAGGVEVEAFVHGALCVSYSGQCFSSEAWGGRSANRGQCSQACRLDYGLLVDGQLHSLGDVQYLLSPQDLAAVELVPQLIRAGVVSFKIEGRLKGPEYVALTTKVYRQAVDAAWAALTAQHGGVSGGVTTAAADNGADNGADNDADGTHASSGGRFSAHVDASQGAHAAGAGEASGDGQRFEYRLDEAQWQELAQVFARGQDAQHNGLTPGFLEGPQHQRLVRGRAPRHRGVFLGEVESVNAAAGAVRLRLAAPLRLGDGLVFDQGAPQQQEEGGAVYEIRLAGGPAHVDRDRTRGSQRGRLDRPGTKQHRGDAGSSSSGQGRASGKGSSVREAPAGSTVEVGFGRGQVQWAAVAPGQLVWKNKDATLEPKIRAEFENPPAAQRRRLPVAVSVTAAVGSPLQVTLTDAAGRSGSGATECKVEAATGRALSAADVERAIGKNLGDQGSFTVASCDVSGCDFGAGAGLFVPGAAIKEARRAAVASLQRHIAAASARPPPLMSPQEAVAALQAQVQLRSGEEVAGRELGVPMLRVLCRTKAQVDAALALPWLPEIVLDFLEVHGLREAAAAVQVAGRRAVVATPRIMKPDERRLWLFYLRLGADALLLRSAGLLQQLNELGGPGAIVPGCPHPIPPLEGDFSLNAANQISADLMLRCGLQRLAPTHDCDALQLRGIAEGLGPRARRLEAILHTNLPIFHTEHCVFARFLSTGNSFLDCGHPCEHHSVHLRDPTGKDHLVLADQGCRNTVFDGMAQSGLPFLTDLVAAGYGCFRIELVDQPAAEVGPLLEGYRRALADAVALRDAQQQEGGGGAAGREARGGAERRQRDLWRWMQGEMRDANGRVQGVGLGSLEVRAERAVAGMKPTAASLRERGGS